MGTKKVRVFIGIDIGKDGGISAISEDFKVKAYTIPKIGNKVDYNSLFEILYLFRKYDVYVGLEDVHGFAGASTKATFSFGEIKGLKIGMVVALVRDWGWKWELIPPKSWQKEVWTNADKIYKPRDPKSTIKKKKIDTKKTSMMAAARLFPKEGFKRTPNCKNPHDGMVDAVLIGLYMYIRYK